MKQQNEFQKMLMQMMQSNSAIHEKILFLNHAYFSNLQYVYDQKRRFWAHFSNPQYVYGQKKAFFGQFSMFTFFISKV